MEINEENLGWAMKQIGKFSHMRGKPADEQLDLHARALLRLVRSEDLAHELLWADGSKHFTGDWLVESMLEMTTYFPNPIDFRKLYCRYFVAADGKSTADVLAALED